MRVIMLSHPPNHHPRVCPINSRVIVIIKVPNDWARVVSGDWWVSHLADVNLVRRIDTKLLHSRVPRIMRTAVTTSYWLSIVHRITITGQSICTVHNYSCWLIRHTLASIRPLRSNYIVICKYQCHKFKIIHQTPHYRLNIPHTFSHMNVVRTVT